MAEAPRLMKAIRLPFNSKAIDESLSCAGHSTQRKNKIQVRKNLWLSLVQSAESRTVANTESRHFRFGDLQEQRHPPHHFSSDRIQPHTSILVQKKCGKAQQNTLSKLMV